MTPEEMRMHVITKKPLERFWTDHPRARQPDDELVAATAVIHSLIDQPSLSRAELDYLDVLDHLVEKYEDATIPLDSVSDANMLRSLLDSRRETQADVAKGAGIAESTISEV